MRARFMREGRFILPFRTHEVVGSTPARAPRRIERTRRAGERNQDDAKRPDQADRRAVEPNERNADSIEVIDEGALIDPHQHQTEHDPHDPADAVATPASVNSIPMIWRRRAPIARSRPSSRLRSVMIAENSTLSINAVLANMIAIRASMPFTNASNPWRIDASIDSPATTLTPVKFARTAKRTCCEVAPGASCSSAPDSLPGASGACGPANSLHREAHLGQRLECHEQGALVGAHACLSEPAVDGHRRFEQQQLGAQRIVSPPAEDDVSLADRPIKTLLEPRLDREIARRVERDHVDGLALASMPDKCSKDQLRRYLLHALILWKRARSPSSSTRSVGSAVSRAAVMLVSAPSGTTSMSAPRRVNPTAMLQSMLRIRTPPVNTTPPPIATPASNSSVRALRRPRFCRAIPASRKPAALTEFAHPPASGSYSVHERVCFMCSTLGGMITQS